MLCHRSNKLKKTIYYFIFLIKRDCYYIYRQSPYAFEPLPLKSEFRTAMLLDPNETANWIPYVIPLGPTTESHIIRYLFPERSLGRVPVDLAFATTMHLPFNESIFPENSGICALLFNYSMFIFLQETQISFDLYAAVICVALKQNKHASELPLLDKNIPKDHDGIFPPVLPTSISVPPIDINLALFPSGNCVIFSIFLDNRLLFYIS